MEPSSSLPKSRRTAAAAPITTSTLRLVSDPPPPSVNKTQIHHNFSAAATRLSHRQLPHHNYPEDRPPIVLALPAQGSPLASFHRPCRPSIASGQLAAMTKPRGLPRSTTLNPSRMGNACQPLHATMTNPSGLSRPNAPNLSRIRNACQLPRAITTNPGGLARLNAPSPAQMGNAGQPPHLNRPIHLQQGRVGSTSSGVKGIPVSSNPKAPPPPPSAMPDGNGYKDTRAKDDNVFTVFDRKVRVSEGASLYAQCRSWLRNGVHEEPQPQFADAVRTLPRPLPMPVAEEKKEAEADKEEEDEVNVDELSLKDLLKMHVTRAKKVRASLREERLQRIGRYKNRLALLLPPVGDQQPRKDSTSGNETPRTT